MADNKAGQTEFTVYHHHPHWLFDFHKKFQISISSLWITPFTIESVVQGRCDHILCHEVELNMPKELVSVQLTSQPMHSSVVSGNSGP